MIEVRKLVYLLALISLLIAILYIAILWNIISNQAVISLTANQQQMIDLTDNYRIAHGLRPLAANTLLDSSAQQKANMICVTGHWDHTDVLGRPFSYLITTTGYNYEAVGENLARGYANEQDAFTALVHSPEHLANIVGDYRDIGVGFNSCGGKNYTVIHYGRL